MAAVKGSRVAEPIRGAQAGAANMNGPRQKGGDTSDAEAIRRAKAAPMVQQLGRSTDAEMAYMAYRANQMKQQMLPEKERASMDGDVQRAMIRAAVYKAKEKENGPTYKHFEEREAKFAASDAAKAQQRVSEKKATRAAKAPKAARTTKAKVPKQTPAVSMSKAA